MTSWILYCRIGLRRRRSRVSRCSTASSPPSVSTVTSGCGASARSAAGSADAAVASPASPSAMRFGRRHASAGVGALRFDAGCRAGPSIRSLAISAGCACRRGLGLDGGLGAGAASAARRAESRPAGLGASGSTGRVGGARRHLGDRRLDRRSPARRRSSPRRPPRRAARRGSRARASSMSVRSTRPRAARLVVLVGLGRQALLLGDQPFAVGDGDLIVVGMDFGEGQEAVAVAAIFHERRLQRRFDADDLRQVDVALEGLAARRLEIEFFKSCSIDHDHPSFLGVARIDEHAPCHGSLRGVGSLTGASDRRPSRLCGARGTVRHRPVERPTLGQDGEASRRRTTTRSCRPRVSYSHRLPDSPSASPPRPISVGAPTRPGSETAVGARRPPERRALRTTATARGPQHTGFPGADNQNIALHE